MAGHIAGHVEKHPVPTRRLGRRPADQARLADRRRTLQFADILKAAPAHSTSADHLGPVTDWTMLGNDQFGDCGPVSVANSRRVTTKLLTGTEQQPTLDQVFDLYRRSGNPTFDPKTGKGDDGVDMSVMLKAAMDGGFAGVKPVAYASVNVSKIDECQAAIDLFGYLLLGVDLQVAQQTQTDATPAVWDYKKSGTWGGHAICAGSYTGASAAKTVDVSVVTWAQIVGVTDAFWTKQVSEAWVVIWPEHLGSKQFHAGIDTAAANAAFTALTGKPGPFPSAPTPAPPTPPPTPAPPTPPPPGATSDAALWAAAQSWAKGKGLK